MSKNTDHDDIASNCAACTGLNDDEIVALLKTEADYDLTSKANTVIVPKRLDYIAWDDYFMSTAVLSGMRSKDPLHPSGCCVVDKRQRIVGVGYNGFPIGCSDDELPWVDSSDNALHTKHPYMVHAEVNAILNKCSHDVTGCTLYVESFPCNECAKVIVQSRISKVVYRKDPEHESDASKASRIMLKMAGIELVQYESTFDNITIDFGAITNVANANIEKVVDDQSIQEEKKTADADTLPYTNDQPNGIYNEYHRNILLEEAMYDIKQHASSKRTNYLSWDDYFMAMAFLTAQRSKDPNTQVGACIVDSQKRLVGLGYNGFPSGCSDDHLPWDRQALSPLHNKYMYVCHAEVNAVLNKGSADLNGTTLYVAMFPCCECAKVIIQAGIRNVVYMRDPYRDTDSCRASRILFAMAGVELRQYAPSESRITIDLSST